MIYFSGPGVHLRVRVCACVLSVFVLGVDPYNYLTAFQFRDEVKPLRVSIHGCSENSVTEKCGKLKHAMVEHAALE